MYDVIVAGAGPVGMTLGLDLAWRGVTALVVDPREGPVSTPAATTSRPGPWSTTAG